jgi:hypothetical protein
MIYYVVSTGTLTAYVVTGIHFSLRGVDIFGKVDILWNDYRRAPCFSKPPDLLLSFESSLQLTKMVAFSSDWLQYRAKVLSGAFNTPVFGD